VPSEPDRVHLVAGLNRVLSEMIDGISDVKVALWRSKPTSVLHAELDQLLRDLTRWTHSLGDRDLVLGVSPLSFMTSPAGRAPPTLLSGNPTESEVCSLVGGLLRGVECHVTIVLDNSDEASRRLLTEVHRGLESHQHALAELSTMRPSPSAADH
jgi:DNA-binding ferritin-like protein